MTDIVGDIAVRKIAAKRFMLLDSVTIQLDDKYVISIPEGFVYDSGSVPFFFHTTHGCPFGTKADYGYLAHDFLYSRARMGVADMSRQYADRAMREIHRARGMGVLRSGSIYRAVRAFAGKNWV